jgi:hypothetical protein
MDVRGVETTRAEESQHQCGLERGKFAVCGNEITSFPDFAFCRGPFGYEVENEI